MYWCAVVAIPEKPNRMKGAQRPSPEDVAKAKAVLNGMSVLKNEDCTPDQLLELPLTSSQSYGFWHRSSPLTEPNPLWQHPKAGCDVTRYADAYTTMTGASPYSNGKQATE